MPKHETPPEIFQAGVPLLVVAIACALFVAGVYLTMWLAPLEIDLDPATDPSDADCAEPPARPRAQ